MVAFIVVVVGICIFSNVSAMEKTLCVYGSKIDQVICFYQSRLYLEDSSYNILADIAMDAKEMIKILRSRRMQIIKEMELKNVGFHEKTIRSYIVNRARRMIL